MAFTPVPEFIDPAFAKTSPKRSFSLTENERFRLVFVKTGSINSGTAVACVPSVAGSHAACHPCSCLLLLLLLFL